MKTACRLPHRHSREGGNPVTSRSIVPYNPWIPAFAGMTMREPALFSEIIWCLPAKVVDMSRAAFVVVPISESDRRARSDSEIGTTTQQHFLQWRISAIKH